MNCLSRQYAPLSIRSLCRLRIFFYFHDILRHLDSAAEDLWTETYISVCLCFIFSFPNPRTNDTQRSRGLVPKFELQYKILQPFGEIDLIITSN